MEAEDIITVHAPGWETEGAVLLKVFLPKIQRSLDEFQDTWDYYRLSGEGASPLMLWNDGVRLRVLVPHSAISPDPDPEIYEDVDPYHPYPPNQTIPQVECLDQTIQPSIDELVDSYLRKHDLPVLRLRSWPALVMQLVGGWPDGPRICLYMPHILYLVAKLFEQCSSYLLMLSISYAVIQHAIRPDMVISVIYPSHDIYSPR